MAPVWPGPEDHDAYCAPNKYLPPQSESEFLDEVIAWRGEQRLPVDLDSVRRAVENSRHPDDFAPGWYYTPEEVAESQASDPSLASRAYRRATKAGAAVGMVSQRWVDGRRVVIVPVKADLQHYQELLSAELGSDRIIVTAAEHSEQELADLSDRIGEDIAALREAGIELSHWGTAEEGVELNYFAADRETAHRFLGERYPPHVRLNWIGPARMAEEPQPFGSWVIDGTQLTVFYPLPANEERPGSCTVEEYPDRVVVSLSILAPQGMNTTIGGFTPSHATVDLKEPLARPQNTSPALAGVATKACANA
jgi:hypothetical protein